jgi:hypothetical protein
MCIKMFDKCHLRKWRDDWYFDLGYYLSYCMTIMFVCLLFSVIMPISTIFGFSFFLFRYYIEKYNMMFVFVKDFESHGTLRRNIIRYLVFSVMGF